MLTLGIPTELNSLENRVAVVPSVVKQLAKLGLSVLLEAGAGVNAGFLDYDFEDVKIAEKREDVWRQSDIIVTVSPPTPQELALCQSHTILIGLMQPYQNISLVKALCKHSLTSFALELLPRITRAQSMDVLSSQASIAGYKAVLLAANETGKFFPMLTTPAGTIRPAKVLIIGAGVAGLQAIATARRLGALVEAFDVRSATKEQVESLGAKFIDTGVCADGQGGYARELTDAEKNQQQEVLLQALIRSDIVITTAAIPGRAAPKILTESMVSKMKTGAVIVDIAAESGGNCELTVAGETVEHQGKFIVGPRALPAQLAYHASEMYAKNILQFLKHIIKDGKVNLDQADEIMGKTLLTHAGDVCQPAISEQLEEVA